MALRKQASWLDGIGIGISSVCIVHCLLLPLIIALSPAWSAWLDMPDELHPWLLARALPFSGIVLGKAARNSSRARLSLAMGVAGLAIMSIGLLAKSEMAEIAVTSGGAMLVAIAHLRNWRCREHRDA